MREGRVRVIGKNLEDVHQAAEELGISKIIEASKHPKPAEVLEEHPKKVAAALEASKGQPAVYVFRDALKIAGYLGVDLIEINRDASPPVCRIAEYSKFLYEQKQKKKEEKAKVPKTTLKEIRFGPNTAEGDFNFKLKHATEFLRAGDKVKAFVHFKGRSIVFKEQGEILLLRFAQALEEEGKVAELPKLDGKRMSLFLTPKTKKK